MNGVNETNKSNEMITADKIEAVKQEGRSLVCECIKERSRFSRVFETKNGEKAGSEGYARQIEAIRIQLVEKGGKAPEDIGKAFYKK